MFLGKIRGKNFLTQIWVFGSFFYPPRPPGCGGWRGGGVGGQTNFSTGPQLSYYVQVFLAKYELNLLKIGFKNTYFQVFRDFQLFQHPAKFHKKVKTSFFTRGKFWKFWCAVLGKKAKTSIFGHFRPKRPILASFWPKQGKLWKKALGTFFSVIFFTK